MSQPVPIFDPDDVKAMKWTGAATVAGMVLLTGLLFGWAAAALALIACFGTMIFCVALEEQDHPSLEETEA